MHKLYIQNEEKYLDHLLEQYKLFLEMTDKISDRRTNANRFFILLLFAIFTVYSTLLSLTIEKNKSAILLDKHIFIYFFITVAVIGVLFSILWFVTINSYKQLNAGKFSVILEMEKELPYECYGKEWVYLGEGKDIKKYYQFTKVEKFVPILFFIIFLVIIAITLTIL